MDRIPRDPLGMGGEGHHHHQHQQQHEWTRPTLKEEGFLIRHQTIIFLLHLCVFIFLGVLMARLGLRWVKESCLSCARRVASKIQ